MKFTARTWIGARGFTLTELMIVLVVIALIAAFGYPMYRSHVFDTRRSTAMTALAQCKARLERFRSDTGSYATATLGAGATDVCPAHAPVDVPPASRIYDVAFPAAPTATGYTLRATPLAAGPQAGDGFIQLDSTGLQQWDKNNDADADDSGEGSWEK